MDPRTLARLLALGRVAIGAALVAAPSKAASGWLGGMSRRPSAQVAIASVGARDVAIGLGTAWAAGGGESARPWLLASAASDLADLAGTVLQRDALTTGAVVGVGALAGGAAALELWLATQLD